MVRKEKKRENFLVNDCTYTQKRATSLAALSWRMWPNLQAGSTRKQRGKQESQATVAMLTQEPSVDEDATICTEPGFALPKGCVNAEEREHVGTHANATLPLECARRRHCANATTESKQRQVITSRT